MSLGVLTNIAAIYAENNLNQTQSGLQKTLTQLSSGSRINTGADDAAGLSVVDGLQANVSALTQSAQNASDGIGLLQTADGALSQVTNLLNRAVTLATEAANGTLNTNQVGSANAEYQNILQEIGNIGATTNFNGNSIFTGAAKTVFVSDGTASGANSYSESVGVLSDASVGSSGGGLAVLATPTASAPVGTATVGAAVAVSSATTVAATVGTPTVSTTTSAVAGATSTGATAGTPSALTTTGLTASSSLTGTIQVEDGSKGLVSVSLSTASAATAVASLNTAFGYNSTTSTFGTSGLHATLNTTTHQITITAAAGDTGAVSISSPTFSLVDANNSNTAVAFNGASAGGLLAAAGTAAVAGTATSALGLTSGNVASGSFNIVVGSTTVATVNLGSNQTLAQVQATLAASNASTTALSLGAAGYSASINSNGNLVVTGPLSNGATGFNISTSSLSTLGSTSVANVTSAGAGTVTSSSLSTNSLLANSTLTGTLQVQAGTNPLVTVTLSAVTVASAATQLDTAFGYNETTGTYGTSGLRAIQNGNQLQIVSAPGSGNQVTISVPATSLADAANASAPVTFGSNLGGTTGTNPTAGTATLATGVTTTNLIDGAFTVSEGGNVIGTINLGASGENLAALTGSGANSLSSQLTSSGLAALGYTATVTSGNIVFTGPTSNGANEFTLTPTTLQTGTAGNLAAFSTTPVVSTGAAVGTPSTQTTTGLTSSSLFLGTLEVEGGNNAPVSVTLGSGTTGVNLAAAVTALNTAFGYNSTNSTFGASGLGAVASGNQLQIFGQSASTDNVSIVPAGTSLTDTSTSSPIAFTGSGTTTTSYGSVGAVATPGTATLALSLNGNTVSGSFTITEAGNTIGTVNLGTSSTLAQVQTILASASANSGVLGAAGYSASINSGGNLVINGPTSNGATEFSVTGTGLATTPTAATVQSDSTLTTAPVVSTATGGSATIATTAASATTTYTGQFSYGAVGATTAGTFTATGQTAAQLAVLLNTQFGANAATGLSATVNASNQLVISGPTGSTAGTIAAETPAITFGTGVNAFIATPATTTSYSASTASFAATNANGTFSGEIQVGTNAAGGIGTQTTVVAAGTTLANLVTQLNNQYLAAGVGGPSGLTASAGTGSQAGELILTGPAPAVNATALSAANDTLIFGSGTNLVSSSSTVGVDFTLASISSLTASSAQTVLTSVTTAINDVAYQRGIIGADVNELNAASNVASSESVNLTSAQSSIQSTDYGAATSNLAKYQVLSQTGISALAQANSVQQEVLKLLQ